MRTINGELCIDLLEISARWGMTREGAYYHMTRKGAPAPVGRIVRSHYWKLSEVEAYEKEKALIRPDEHD